jgi:flagellar hook-associated protein 2
MVNVSSMGVGSGIDIENLVTGLVAAEGDPKKELFNKRETQNLAKISAYGNTKSALADLKDALEPLTKLETIQPRTVTNPASSFLTLDVTTSVAPGSFDISVDQIATMQKMISAKGVSSATTSLNFTDSQTVTLTNPTTGSVKNIIVEQGASLNEVRDAINEETSNTNIRATILNVSTYRASLGGILTTENSDTSTGLEDSSFQLSSDGQTYDLNLSNTDSAKTLAQSINALSSDVTAAATTNIDVDGLNNSHAIKIQDQTFAAGTATTVSEWVDAINSNSALSTITASEVDGKLRLLDTEGNNILFELTTHGGTDVTVNYQESVTSQTLSADNAKLIAFGSITVEDNEAWSVANHTNAAFNISGTQVGSTLVLSSTVAGSSSAFTATLTAELAEKIGVDGKLNSKNLYDAKDAHLTVDGQSIVRTSNSFDDVIDGITFNLVKEGSGTQQITISKDKTKTRDLIQGFVENFNKTWLELRDYTKYGAEGSSGVLIGDATMRSIQNRLRNTLNTPRNDVGSIFSSLSEIGITTDYITHQLTIDSTKLTKAINSDFDGLGNLFADSEKGIAVEINTYIKEVTDWDGQIVHAIDKNNQDNAVVEEKRIQLNMYLEDLELRLKKQYAAMDSIIASLNSTGDFITQMIDSFSSNKKK